MIILEDYKTIEDELFNDLKYIRAFTWSKNEVPKYVKSHGNKKLQRALGKTGFK